MLGLETGKLKMKKRSLEYEQKFRKYLYSFDFETHKKICINVNVAHIQISENINVEHIKQEK